jgi:single-stranded-DNA-specific exonuclease
LFLKIVEKQWLVNKTNNDFLEYLSRKASISTALAQIFVNRGIKDADAIRDFLSPSLKNLHDPFLMPDMGKAVERIKNVLADGTAVLVCGDYDADGITSAALLVSALRMFGLKTHYHIPNRITEGYGLSKEGVLKAKALGARLIITVDCGVSSEEEVSMAVSQGIGVIITDHHEPPERLPDAEAIINPHRIDSEYPFKYLAGVGVVYKLVQALFQTIPLNPWSPHHGGQASAPPEAGKPHLTKVGSGDLNTALEALLGLVAIGTVADSVPLIGENRILVTYGLKVLNSNSAGPWVNILRETSGIGDKELRSLLLSYTLIPRINAAGRLGQADEVVELFLTQDMAKASGIAYHLEDRNKERQRIEKDVYKSAVSMIDANKLDSAIVLYSSQWHPGVIGIVASRLAEMFYRPTFLFSVKDDIAKGSARSIPTFNLYKGITECAEILLAYGGHKQAAGLRLSVKNLPAFKERINSVVKNTLIPQDMAPTIEIDAAVELFEVNFNLVKELNLLEPFGNSNQSPLLGVKEAEVVDPRVVSNNHLKMRLKQKSVSIDTIGFSRGDLLNKIENCPDKSGLVDAAFVPCINEWNGTKSLQLNLKELRPSS